MIAIADYGLGNVQSLRNALDYAGFESRVTRDPGELLGSTHVILPGVGAFGDAMRELRSRGLADILHRCVFEQGKPFLGVCLGLQMLARTSTEHGLHEGLGWLDATVTRFSFASAPCGETRSAWKVPHMGWNEIEPAYGHPVFAGLRPGSLDFYFVHSFHIQCQAPRDVLATSVYGYPFAAAVAKDNIAATQFHPEKSQDNGLELLANFCRWNP